MDDATKKAIASLVAVEVEKAGSQVKFGARHKVSGATISNAINGKWANIAPSMWKRLGSAVGYGTRDWQVAQTRNYTTMQELCKVAQEDGISIGVSHDSGSGKTFALSQYAAANAEAYYVQCDEYWTKKLLLSNIYRELGFDPSTLSTAELADRIISELRKAKKPLLILDEVDKLRDVLLMFFISLYNKLDGICGFMLVGAPYLSKQWETNSKRDKRGFREIYSRLGRKFIQLKPIVSMDVELVCAANGITDKEAITAIWNSVELEPDMRRVRREIQMVRYERGMGTATA